MTAFALVDPNCNPDNPTQCGPPRLVDAHTRGFVGVNVGARGSGDYCLTPGPGVDVVHTAAVVSEEAFYSYVVGFPVVRYPTAGTAASAANSKSRPSSTTQPVSRTKSDSR
jgi:hypothetical protein